MTNPIKLLAFFGSESDASAIVPLGPQASANQSEIPPETTLPETQLEVMRPEIEPTETKTTHDASSYSGTEDTTG